MNEFQLKILHTLHKSKYHVMDARVIAAVAKVSQVAVSSSLRCMESKQLVGYVPPKDRWDCKHWFITSNGKSLLEKYPLTN